MQLNRLLLVALGLVSGPAAADIALVGCGVIQQGNSPEEIAVPSHSNGDLLVMFAGASASSGDLTLSIDEAGWTTRGSGSTTNGVDRSYLISTKVAASESGTYTLQSVASVSIRGVICAFSGVHADVLDQTTPSQIVTSNTTTWNPPAIVTQTANAWVITFFAQNDSITHQPAVRPTGHSALFLSATTSFPALGASYIAVASPASTDPDSWTGLDDAGASSDVIGTTLALKAAAAAPTFTAAPAISSRTASSIITTFTSDTTGTVYSARLTDGSATPTCDQLEAQTATGGLQYKTEAVVATVSDGETFDSITSGAPTDGYFCIEDGSGNDSAVASIADMYKLPDITTGPTVGTKTDTTIPFTFTSDSTGTVYGVACPDGQAAPSVSQVKLGDCTGDINAVSAFSEPVVLAVSDGAAFTGLTASTTYDTHFVANSPGGDETAITSVADQTTNASAAGVFTVNPTVTSQTTVQYVLGGTTGATASISSVACAKDTTAPTIVQVQAGQCTGNVSAIASQNDTWNGADSLILGGSLTFPIHDLYITDGTNLVTLIDEVLDIPSAKQRLTLTSVHATSPYVGYGAVGDICTVDDRARTVAATPDAGGYVVTDSVDGTLSYASGGDTDRRFVVSQCYDLSGAVNLDFLIVFSNFAPRLGSGEVAFFEGDLFARGTNPAIDLALSAIDEESDAIGFSVVSGSIPTNWTLNANGTITGGSPGACESKAFTIRMADPYGATKDVVNDLEVGPILPDLAGTSVVEAQATIEALCQ